MVLFFLPTTAEVGGSQVRMGLCYSAVLGPSFGCILQVWHLYHFPEMPVPMLDKMLRNALLHFFLSLTFKFQHTTSRNTMNLHDKKIPKTSTLKIKGNF